MRAEKITADRLAAYSDAVFAVIVTIMVLELKAPDEPALSALWPLWPTIISYAVSYLFIAIIWINHHHLMRFVGPPTLGLMWINFVHLFMVRSEEHTSELQSLAYLVCRLLLEKKKTKTTDVL